MSGKQRGIEKKLVAEAAKEKKKAEDEERKLAQEWSVGTKENSKLKDQEQKEAERRRLAAEKSALEAREEAEASEIKRVVKTKKKGKDDFDLLNAALAAMPKSKAQKEAEAKKAEAEARKKKEAEARERNLAAKKAEEDRIKALAAQGIVVNHQVDYSVKVNNRLDDDDEINVTGLDSALDAMSMGDGNNGASKNMKALFKTFCDQQLPSLKEQYPNLKHSQYQQRLSEMWKYSPENPMGKKNTMVSRDQWKIDLAAQEAAEENNNPDK